jgi:acyl-CoA synthetase (AMP-forming)/AMP-acid ligase II
MKMAASWLMKLLTRNRRIEREDTLHNVLAVLRDVAARFPERPALVMEDDAGREARITFAGLWERVDRVSVGLRRCGLQAGDRAIVMIPMSIDLYAALLGLLKMGAVAVFVDPWIGARQIAAFAAFAEPRAFLGIPKSHALRLLDRRLRDIPVTVTTGGRLGALPARRGLAELEKEAGDGEVHPVAPDDPALVTFTSGSSGEPKGANRTHGFLLAQHRALAAEFPARDGEVDMPMFPVFALNNLASGVTSVVPAMDFRRVEAVDAARILRQMQKHRVATCTASPPFFDRLAERLKVDLPDRPPLRRLLTGGAPVSDAQLRAWRRALPDSEILVVYGSTEAEPVAHLTAEERLDAANDLRPRAPGYCVGHPSPRVRTKVIRIHDGPVELGPWSWKDWEVASGEIGELLVSGDHVGRDYYRNPQAVRENKIADRDGTVWHRMGDTGSFDSHGRFWIAGRVHSTIQRRSGPVHPQLVEQAASGGDERIRRLAAVGLPDPLGGERAVLVVETESGPELMQDITARLDAAGLEVDDTVFTRDPLPVDPRHNSKIDYRKLRERLTA